MANPMVGFTVEWGSGAAAFKVIGGGATEVSDVADTSEYTDIMILFTTTGQSGNTTALTVTPIICKPNGDNPDDGFQPNGLDNIAVAVASAAVQDTWGLITFTSTIHIQLKDLPGIKFSCVEGHGAKTVSTVIEIWGVRRK